LAIVLDLALIGLRALLRSFVKYGNRPHFKTSRWRSPFEFTRTTGASIVGAIFHVGARFGSGFTVVNNRAMNSAGRKLA
jgi:hypothetical protein